MTIDGYVNRMTKPRFMQSYSVSKQRIECDDHDCNANDDLGHNDNHDAKSHVRDEYDSKNNNDGCIQHDDKYTA